MLYGANTSSSIEPAKITPKHVHFALSDALRTRATRLERSGTYCAPNLGAIALYVMSN